MLRNIRKSVWETNSSSVHSLVVCNIDSESSQIIKISKDLSIEFYGGEYGWGPDSCDTAEEKANYLAVYLMLYSKDADKIEMFERVIKEVTGAETLKYMFLNSNGDSDYGDDNWSYIDPQGYEDGNWDLLFASDDTLKDFIFNRKYSINISNDNM